VDQLAVSVPKVRENAAGQEVWITEYGFSTCDPANPQVIEWSKALPVMAPVPVTEKQQGDYLTRQTLVTLADGVDRAFIYQLGPDGEGGEVEDQWGVTRVRANGISPKVAYVQLGTLVRELAGAKPIRMTSPTPNTRIAWFSTAKGKVAAVWVVKGHEKLSFRVRIGQIIDPFGNRRIANPRVILDLTESPVYIAGADVVVGK